ncbi:MAG: 2-amino-4-hydroxy-6-hydroxymethyldihydropteridine diphosphokinase [Acidimicrobiia bacterium]|nr:2-amino-4-hydroxy-6-hydroxymethyldihydropteridine diphosphokinase [Acidimicrobiia bacterium]
MPKRRQVFLGLGSNLGDRVGFLRDAVAGLADLAGVSDVYETAAVGGPEQGNYLNLVVELHTALSARQLLGLCRELEGAAQRVRTVRWGARTLDVDVLWIDGENINETDLIVPHPRMFERSFVLVPLRDLAPELLPDGFDADTASRVDQVVCLGRLEAQSPRSTV